MEHFPVIHLMNKASVIGQVARLMFALLGGMLLAWVATWVILLIQTSFDVQVALGQANRLLEDTGMLRLVQGVQSLSLFVMPPFLLCLINHEHPADVLSFRKASGRHIMLAVISLIAAMPLINLLVTWNESMRLPSYLHQLEEWMRVSEKTAADLTQRMMSGTAWHDLAFSLIVVALLAGFGEELLFRGLLQGMLVRILGKKHRTADGKVPSWVKHTSIWTVAFLFSAIHLQFFGFFPRLLLGAWFGYLLWWTGSIWVPILAHMSNNALSTVFLFAKNNGWISVDPDQFGTNETGWTSVVSILLLAACVVLFKQKRLSAGK